MTTKKSRKRAYIPPSSEVVNRRERTEATSRPAARPARGSNQRGSANYQYPLPSLKRTAKRLPIYFLLIFGLQFYLLQDAKGDSSTGEIALFAAGQAGIVTLVFAPFMHLMDKLAYNRWLKRSGK